MYRGILELYIYIVKVTKGSMSKEPGQHQEKDPEKQELKRLAGGFCTLVDISSVWGG